VETAVQNIASRAEPLGKFCTLPDSSTPYKKLHSPRHDPFDLALNMQLLQFYDSRVRDRLCRMTLGLIDVLKIGGFDPELATSLVRHQDRRYPIQDLRRHKANPSFIV
jgi:hypothetical protein